MGVGMVMTCLPAIPSDQCACGFFADSHLLDYMYVSALK